MTEGKKARRIPVRDCDSPTEEADAGSDISEPEAEHEVTEKALNTEEPESGESVADEKETSPEDKLEEMKLNWQRERASFRNYKRRVEEEKASIRKYASYDLAFELLRVIDYFESSVTFSKNIPDEARNVLIGVEYTIEELKRILASHGIKRIEVKPGDIFDSAIMEATVREVSREIEPGYVIEVARSGWMLHDRILRTPQVIVSVEEIQEDDEPDSVDERGEHPEE